MLSTSDGTLVTKIMTVKRGGKTVCPASRFQQMVSGKYKLRILWGLQDGWRRYSEIKKGLLTGSVDTKERSSGPAPPLGMKRRVFFATATKRKSWCRCPPLGRPCDFSLRQTGVCRPHTVYDDLHGANNGTDLKTSAHEPIRPRVNADVPFIPGEANNVDVFGKARDR